MGDNDRVMNCEWSGLLILLDNLVLHSCAVELLHGINEVQEELEMIIFSVDDI